VGVVTPTWVDDAVALSRNAAIRAARIREGPGACSLAASWSHSIFHFRIYGKNGVGFLRVFWFGMPIGKTHAPWEFETMESRGPSRCRAAQRRRARSRHRDAHVGRRW